MDLMAILEALHQKNMAMKDQGYGNLAGFENMVKGSTDTHKNMADGGLVDEELPESSLSQVLTNINQTPPTDYTFYKNMTAEDRNALAQKLMAQKASAGNLIGSGLAGLGDAISNSYGGKNTSFQKDFMAGQDKAAADRLSAFDTQRSQKMQDFQGTQMAQENDPNSPLAQSMRQVFQANGMQMPSQMPVSLMVKVAGPLGDFAYKQAQQAIQQQQNAEAARHNQAEETQQVAALKQQAAIAAQAQRDKAADNKREALTARSKVGLLDEIFHPEIGNALDEQAGIAGTTNYTLPKLGEAVKHASGAIIHRRK